MSDIERSWCPDCKRWVPSNKMFYFEGTRACQWCLEGTEQPKMVIEQHHEDMQCIYCDSYDTVEQVPEWRKFKCNACGATFRI